MADTEEIPKMEQFLLGLPDLDNKKKLTLAAEILKYLKKESNPIKCSNIGSFIGEFISWLKSCSPRVVESALKILIYIVERMGYDFRPYSERAIPSVIDNLSNSKVFVKEECKNLLKKIIEKGIVIPKHMFDNILPSFTHKNATMRAEAVKMLIIILERFGIEKLSLKPIIVALSNILNDSHPDVRNAVNTAFCIIYRLTGKNEKLRFEIQSNYKGVDQPERIDNLFKAFDKIVADDKKTPKPSEHPEPVKVSKAPSKAPSKAQQEIRKAKRENIAAAQAAGRPPTAMEQKVIKHVEEIANMRSILASIVRRLNEFDEQLSFDNRNA